MGLYTIVLIFISLGLMFADKHYAGVAKLRSELEVVVLPIQWAVDKPIQLKRWAQLSFSGQQQLLKENAQLRARQLLVEAKLQKLLALEQENQQLRQLLTSSAKIQGKILVAQLLAVSLDSLTQEILLDIGTKAHIYIGQPVLDAYGVMGQVIKVSPFTSQVLLITDTRSAIPAQDNRSGVRVIVAGLGASDQLNLLNLPATADIAVGDLLVTSGLGQKFSFGYPLAVVHSIDRNTGDGFAHVIATPSAHINRSRQVVLIWPQPSAAMQGNLPFAQPTIVADKKT